jgi:glycerol kinase
MKSKYIIALDQSTTSTKVFLIDREGRVRGSLDKRHRQMYPQPGWVDHDPDEIYRNSVDLIHGLLEENSLTEDRIAAVALTNQRETTVVWNKKTGKPVCNASVWQCLRSKEICEGIIKDGADREIKDKTGYMPVPSAPGGKLTWILEHVKGAREMAEAGELLYGTTATWLLWKFTDGKVHATDHSNASRTLLYNINKLEWDKGLMNIFGVPRSMLPTVKYSDEIFGYTGPAAGFSKEIPITGIMGDSFAAMFGHACYGPGSAKATYGTGSSIVMNVGTSPVESKNGLVTSIAWGMNGSITYVTEGNVNFSGAVMQWLCEDLGLLPNLEEVDEMASDLENNEGMYFVPAFNGLGAPYWDNDAKAAIVGISRNAKKENVVRAALESIAYQNRDIIDLMTGQSGVGLPELRVDGGGTKNRFLMQFQADILGVPLSVAGDEDTSAVGSAYMAGIAAGMWKSLEEIEKLRSVKEEFRPRMAREDSDRYYAGWKDAVGRVLTKAAD